MESVKGVERIRGEVMCGRGERGTEKKIQGKSENKRKGVEKKGEVSGEERRTEKGVEGKEEKEKRGGGEEEQEDDER